MVTRKDEGRGSALKPLSVGYLVWHVVVSSVVIALLARVTAAYAGALPVASELPGQVEVLGARVPAWVFIAGTWVVLVPVAVAGVLFAIWSLRALRAHGLIGRAVVLGRVMFALCCADLLLSFVQGNGLLLLVSCVSAALTGALALEVRKFEGACAAEGEAPRSPRPSFVAQAAEGIPIREIETPAERRGTFRALSGYSTIMLAWGGLRILAGLTMVFAMRQGEGAVVSGLASGLLVMASGAYLVAVGRLGKRSLGGSSTQRTFLIAAVVGLVASLALLVLYVVWLVGGWALASQDVFSTCIDAALYACGTYYAFKRRG